MMNLQTIALIGLGMLGFVVSPAQAEAFTTTAQQGNVKAELSYEKALENGILQAKNVRLKIQRSGQSIFDQLLKNPEFDRPIAFFTGSGGLTVQDLNGDNNPEVITDMFTGGAHCCTYSLIYQYNLQQKQYVESRANWGNLGYRLRDLDGDGKTEFYSANDRFAYAFTSYAGSAFPVMILRFEKGSMVDVTRQYPKQIYSDAYRLWQTYKERSTSAGDATRGVLAAYLADKYLLGQQEDGWKRLESVYKGSDRSEFFGSLRTFLKKTGYAK
jgi:hypothetical protein